VAAASNDGITALMLAAHGGHEAVAQLLLQHGADVAAASNAGGTALMLAAVGGHVAVAQLLLQHGADVR
jgi:ankyrin repeat protein